MWELEGKCRMKIAYVYSICGVHKLTIDGVETRVCDVDCPYDPADEEDDDGVYHAYWSIAKIELEARNKRVTDLIDLDGAVDVLQEQPIPIDVFFERWRSHVNTTR